MRDYGKVHTSFWTSDSMRKLSEDGRALALYLLTSPHGTLAGVMRLPDGYVCEDMQWEPERVAKGFSELLAKGFANRCETTKWTWVVAHFEWNPLDNPNQQKSARKILESIPAACGWKRAFMRDCGVFIGLPVDGSANPSVTVPKGSRNQEQEQEQDQEKTKSDSPSVPEGGPLANGRLPAGEAQQPAAERDAKAQAKAQRLAAVTSDAIDAYNAALARPKGLLPAVTLKNEERQKQVKRCLKVASEISMRENGAPTLTPEFWKQYFETAEADDFHAGRVPGGKGHANWVPDFEFLTRPDTMTKLYDRAVSE